MRKVSLVATLTVALSLIVASVASANYVDQNRSNADCVKATLVLTHFDYSDGPVNWIVTVDGQPNTAGAVKAFKGEKTIVQAISPGPLTGPGSHTVVFRAAWDGKVESFTKTVTGCPPATPVPPKPLPCPDQPPTAPCNCPPGPAGPAGPPGITTTITVIEKHETVTYVDKTCTSQRVFHLRSAQRLPRDDVFGKDAGQKITGYRITWRGADAAHNRVVKSATATLRLGKAGETDRAHKRLRANADFRNVVAVPGQVRVINERITLANGHVLRTIRKVRLCLGADGDLNVPSSLPQNGHANGAEADAARAAAAKDPKYRKAVI